MNRAPFHVQPAGKSAADRGPNVSDGMCVLMHVDFYDAALLVLGGTNGCFFPRRMVESSLTLDVLVLCFRMLKCRLAAWKFLRFYKCLSEMSVELEWYEYICCFDLNSTFSVILSGLKHLMVTHK